jgi:hypothetical protein
VVEDLEAAEASFAELGSLISFPQSRACKVLASQIA